MNEYIFKPHCTYDFELDERDRTTLVDWYGTLHGEIVRCRDCRWISKDTKHYKACYRLPDCEFMVEPDGFCWKGERDG